ncbi:MAG: hypothetical protein KGL46_05270 [Hyphomicrobiales bacterium]|nr:hypothetical protein [Hyphomicrobiales bacterium]
MKTVLSIVAGSVVAAALLTAPADARHRRYQEEAYDGPAYTQRMSPRYCEKLCTGDVTPCDPPEYKRVDGRCNFQGGMPSW